QPVEEVAEEAELDERRRGDEEDSPGLAVVAERQPERRAREGREGHARERDGVGPRAAGRQPLRHGRSPAALAALEPPPASGCGGHFPEILGNRLIRSAGAGVFPSEPAPDPVREDDRWTLWIGAGFSRSRAFPSDSGRFTARPPFSGSSPRLAKSPACWERRTARRPRPSRSCSFPTRMWAFRALPTRSARRPSRRPSRSSTGCLTGRSSSWSPAT